MRVLVCGGRNYDNHKAVAKVLTELHDERGIHLIVTGGAAGADRAAERWAFRHKVAVCVFPANWQFEGRAAGPIRNQRMLRFIQPDMVVAFPGGPGTQGMIGLAESAGTPVTKVAA